MGYGCKCEHTTSRRETVKGVGTQTKTVSLVCYWVTVVSVETQTATASLVLSVGYG